MDTHSQQQQFKLLSTISNFQHIQYPSFSRKRKSTTCTNQFLRYLDHILYDPTCRTNSDGLPSRKYIPSSPRNKCSYFAMCEDGEAQLCTIIKYLLKIESLSQSTPTLPSSSDVCAFESDQPPPKKRKHTPKLLSVNPRLLCDSVGEDLNKILNSAKQNRDLYTKFKEHLISDGTIKWRLHTQQLYICVMSDINPTTGLIVPSSFVHVTSTKQNTGEYIVKCTCEIYMIKRAATKKLKLVPTEDTLLDNELTCMHCRFYLENLTNAHELILNPNTTQTKILTIVNSSLQFMNDPVQLLGGVQPRGSTKFSVNGDPDYSVVSITFPNGKCYAKCYNGTCKARMQNRKKIPK